MAFFVTESQVAELLDMPTALAAVEEVMRLHGQGCAVNHPRQRVRRERRPLALDGRCRP
jgi:alanine dehydrogenase